MVFKIHIGNNNYYANITLSSNYSGATIYSLKYNNNINIKEDLEKVTDSGIQHIVYTAMSLTLLMYSNIKYFKLRDGSLKSCYQSSRLHKKIFKTVDLGLYYVIFYKNTWYNRIFNMKILDEDGKRQYEFDKLLNKLTNNEHKQSYEWFYEMILTDYFDTEQLQKYQELYNIEKLYRGTYSYYDFFKALQITINNEHELCLFMTYFIVQFINIITCGNTLRLLASTYYIESDNITKIDIQIPLVETIDNWEPSNIYNKYKYTDMIRLTCTQSSIHFEDECDTCYLDKTRL